MVILRTTKIKFTFFGLSIDNDNNQSLIILTNYKTAFGQEIINKR